MELTITTTYRWIGGKRKKTNFIFIYSVLCLYYDLYYIWAPSHFNNCMFCNSFSLWSS